MAHIEELEHGATVPMHAADLYLTAACRRGCSAALEALEKVQLQGLRAPVRRLVRDESAIDDVLQEIRRRLLVGRSPKIASYRGFGTLQSWLCAIAVNTAKDHVRAERTRRSRALAATHCQLLTLGEVPPQAGAGESLLNGRLTAECVQAVRQAFRSLELKDRRLLQEHFISGLSIDKLVPSYLVNRATIARRIQRTTGRIRQRVRRQLASRFRGETAEALDAIAFSTCRDHLLDVAGLLGP